MPWLKQDDGMGEHRKTRRLLKRNRSGIGLAAFGLHSLAMLHAAKYLTDGFVDHEFVEDNLDDANVTGKMRAAVVDALTNAGQWTVADGGWLIHDYLDHNPSRAEIESKREAESKAKSDAGRKGAEARWGKRDKKPRQGDGSVLSVCDPDDGSVAIGADSPVPSRPDHDTPKPPEGAFSEPPRKPTSGRRREVADYDLLVEEYAAWLLPDLAEPHRTQTVRSALGGAVAPPLTNERVAEWVRRFEQGEAA